MTRTEDVAASPGGAARGFRPGSRRRTRIAAGVVIAAVAVGGNVLVYSSLDDTALVVQFVDNVDAGDQIASDDVRIIEIGGDVSSANLVPADQVGLIVNQYARTFIPSGSLASVFVVQSTPLVTTGAAVVAVTPDGNLVPDGLRERSSVRLIIGQGELTLIDARVVAVERNDAGGASSLSVEVNEADAPIVAAAEQLRVALLDPGIDPATEAEG